MAAGAYDPLSKEPAFVMGKRIEEAALGFYDYLLLAVLRRDMIIVTTGNPQLNPKSKTTAL
jgi:hypothetical protein